MSFFPTDQDNALPNSWTLAPLGEVTELNPRPNLSAISDDQEVHFVPMAAVAADFQGLDISARRRLTEVRKGYTAFQGGDVLLAKITPCMENGKGGLVPVLPMRLAFGSTEFHVLRPTHVIHGQWLSHFLSQPAFRRVARQNMTGTAGQLRVPSKWLADVNIPVAPKNEQERVVAKLDELLSDLDAGVAELKAAQQKLQRYRQSLLKAAVEGALTAEWRTKNPPTETGAELLQRILRERRARWEAQQLPKFAAQGKAPPKGWKDKYPEPQPPKTEGLPELPEGWVWASLGQLLSNLTSGSRDWAPFYDRGECTFVMAQNVRPWRPDFSFRQSVDPPKGNRDRARSEVREDDLLLTIVGANTGQACRVPEPLIDHFVCQSVALLRPVVPSTSEFLNAVLNSDGHGQQQFRAMNYGAGRPHLSFEQIESVSIPLPPLDEQKEALAILAECMRSSDSVATYLDQVTRESAAQRQCILRAAFRGELVPQGPNDEPASVLLERLRAERSTTAKPTKAEHKTRKAARVA